MSRSIGIGMGVGIQAGPLIRPNRIRSWPFDLTAKKGLPVAQEQIDAIHLHAGIPPKVVNSMHSFDDASGASAAASVGTAYTITGTVDYRKAVAGYAKTAMGVTETAAEGMRWGSGTGPSANASIMCWHIIDLPSAPSATRTLFALTLNAANWVVQALTDSTIRILVNAVAAQGVVNHVSGGPFIGCAVHDRTAGLDAYYTNLEKIVGTSSLAVAEGAKGHGTTGTPAPEDALIDWWYGGVNAEWAATRILIEAMIKNKMQSLGFPVAWSPS